MYQEEALYIIKAAHLRWHSLGLSAVAARQGFWLKPGQQRSHDSPQVLCLQLHCSLRKGEETSGFTDAATLSH